MHQPSSLPSPEDSTLGELGWGGVRPWSRTLPQAIVGSGGRGWTERRDEPAKEMLLAARRKTPTFSTPFPFQQAPC